MRAFKSLLVMTAVAGLVAMMWARSFAAPLLPSFPSVWSPNQMIAGQSKLVNPLSAPNNFNDFINVDWIVFYDADGIWGYPGSFVYMYQLENTAGSSAIRAFNVKYGGTGVSDEVGIKAGDLDVNNLPLWLGHNTTNFANLNDETEPGGSPQGIPANYNALRLLDSVSFTTIDIGITQESLVLYIIDPRPPMYGEARAQDGANWWGMVTFLGTTYGDPVPVPSPEPQVALLLLAGLTGMLVRLRMSKS